MLTLPGYDIEKLIHESSASALYRGRRQHDGRRVVVKVPQANAVNARQLTRYRNEYDILLSLDHDCIVKTYALLRQKGQVALILEEFDGVSLKSWRAHSRPGLPALLQIAIDLTRAIGYVHSAGIVHKDINSHNVLINPESLEIRLIDFGIASRLASEEGRFESAAALEGTLAYIAPEQTGRMNRSVDYRADWYSLGVTLYELFSGRLPHDSHDPLESVHFHIAGKAAPLAELDARIPRAVSAIVSKLLQKEPEDRYQSMDGIVADLQNCSDQLRDHGHIEDFEPGSADGMDRFELPEKLYGRERQIDLLLEAFDRVTKGSVEALLVAGKEGTGKTSLVQELYRHATGRGIYVAAGKYDQLRRDVPFTAIVDALQDLVSQLLTENAESIEAWRTAIMNAVGVNGRVITEVIPALELIIGPQPELKPLPGTEAQNRFNLCFQSFIQALATRSRSLVLFLDDMQWADAASLNLVTVILSAPATESLLVVLSYRDNETSATHPFLLATRDLENRGVPIAAIELDPLSEADIERLLVDTLRRRDAAVSALASVVHRKTGGNPFFVRQFVHSLSAESLITFDKVNRQFAFDVDAIEATTMTDNVADLLTATLGKLTPAARNALQVAAAIGQRFDLGTLAIVLERTPADTFALLQSALNARLVAPVSALEELAPDKPDSPLVYRRMQFAHDRIQQAAYGSLAPAERPGLHLAIGRVLRAGLDHADSERHLFDVVSHLNLGAELIESADERLQLASLNLRAGVKSRDSTAHAIARQLFAQALMLLGGEQAWAEHPALAFETQARLAEVCSLTADHDAAIAAIDSGLEHTSEPTRRMQLFALEVSTFLGMGALPEALACGRAAAAQFGIELPDDSEQAASMLDAEMKTILARTESIGIERLPELPVMEDEASIAMMGLLTNCLPAAYQTNQQLFSLICCKMISMSLDKGNCPLSARAYGSFAALLSGVMGRHRESYAYAKLAVDLAHRFGDTSVYSGVHFLLAMFASHWQEPIDVSIELLARGTEYGLQTGDHVHGGYCAARRICHLQFRGMALDELYEQACTAHDLLTRIGDLANLAFIEPRLRFIAWLRDETRSRSDLGTPERDEAQCTASIAARGNKSFESDWFMLLTKQRYLAREYAEARRFAQTAEPLLPYSAAFVTGVDHRFYVALTLCALADTADDAEAARLEAELAVHMSHLAEAAEECPANYRHLWLLADAERTRSFGATLDAMRLYDEAIDAANAQGFTHIAAMSAELAADYWMRLSKPEFAQLYVARALSDYETWGAGRKLADLRERFGMSRRAAATHTSTAHSTTLGTSSAAGSALDLATALKASQALASEIVLEKLLTKMLSIVLESAGGERIVLVLESDGEMRVQAVQDNATSRTELMIDEPLGTTTELSRGVVNYVLRTSENLVLANPATTSRFRNDPYVRDRQPKSVLSAPILHKGRLTGVIYIENDQVAGAFTPARLEALNILMSQIAVSIDNATLYARLERQTDAIERTNAALAAEVDERRRAEAELSLYRDHLEDLVAQRTRDLEKAQSRLLDVSRRAGMAEVASGVLHNVGNVMNSVNVGAHVVRDSIRALRIEGLQQVAAGFDDNSADLGAYMTSDPVGQRIPEYLGKLARALAADKAGIGQEVDRLLEHLEHMKKIIAAQQSYAKTKGLSEVCSLEEIVETALEIAGIRLRDANIEVVKDCGDLRPGLFDRHQILQILVNLIGNARHALQESARPQKTLTITAAEDSEGFLLEVRDNGIGIAPENLPKVFTHGFTTKKTGHGFGLHNCANAAQEMDGSLTAFSDGPGQGARFVLRLPAQPAETGARETGSYGRSPHV